MAINTALRRTIPVEFAGQTGEVSYKLGAMNKDYWAKRQELIDAGVQDWPLDCMALLLEDWDLIDDDGNKIPPTREGMEQIIKPLLYCIFETIMDDVKNVRGGS